MKKRNRNKPDELRLEYDLSRLRGGVRGKYYGRATAGSNLVLIEPDIAKAFPNGEAVNNALRRLMRHENGSSPRRKSARFSRKRPTALPH